MYNFEISVRRIRSFRRWYTAIDIVLKWLNKEEDKRSRKRERAEDEEVIRHGSSQANTSARRLKAWKQDRVPIVPVRLQDNSSASRRLGSQKMQPNMNNWRWQSRWNLQSSGIGLIMIFILLARSPFFTA
jgi:hypothetical protein